MAQIARRRHQSKKALSLLGFAPPVTALVAFVLFAAVLVAVGTYRQLSGSSFEVVRGEGLTPPAAEEVDPTASSDNGRGTGDASVKEVLVHVDGAVESPGVYQIHAESPRVNDAIEAAGGLREDADTAALNLAAPVTDGSKVHVTAAGEASAPEGPSGAEDATPSASGLVNINSAGVDELKGLSGVGEATAKSIVEDRGKNGPFSSPEDLMRVSGIGEKKFEKVRDQICV